MKRQESAVLLNDYDPYVLIRMMAAEFYAANGIGTFCFWWNNGERKCYSTCIYEKEFLAFLELGGCLDFMTRRPEGYDRPVIFSDSLGITWIAEHTYFGEGGKELLLIVGPMFMSSTPLKYIEQALTRKIYSVQTKLQMKRTLIEIPVVSASVIIQYGKMLHYTITSNRILSSDFIYQNDQNPDLMQGGEIQLVQNHASDRLRRGEQMILKAVREGNRRYQDILNDELSYYTGYLSNTGNDLRDGKYSVAIFTALCSRAAMEGGLSAKAAMDAEARYYSAIENCISIAQLKGVMNRMLEEYVSRVAQGRKQEDVSRSIRDCCDYIKVNVLKDLTVEEIASEMGYTPYYFTRKFSKEMGIKVGDYIKQTKIEYATVKLLFVPGKKGKQLEGKIDSRNGVNDAWKKMISSEAALTEEPWIEIEDGPAGDDLYVQGTKMSILTGKAAGKNLEVGRIVENRIYFKEGFGMDPIADTLELLEKGDEIHIDNSDYIAIQTYHRHQVPSADYLAWDQFRDEERKPIYPQQPILVGPFISGGGTGVKQDGLIQGKIISVAALMDEQAYPWQPDWYRRKVASEHGGDESDIMRLWYFDNCLHDDRTESEDELYVTTYLAGLKQALIDVAAWVEQGIAPLPSTNYAVNVGEIIVPATADERGGIQPVVDFFANGGKCAHVKAGEAVEFTAKAEVPVGAGKLTDVVFSFEGEQNFPYEGQFDLLANGRAGIAKTKHTYNKPGTYFAVVRVRSERTGDKSALYTQVRNIDRVRVIVE